MDCDGRYHSPMSELQYASCGCVTAHEQPSVSWLTCRLLKTNSRLIRCWYTDCISPNFPRTLLLWESVRSPPGSAPAVWIMSQVFAGCWLLSPCLLASLSGSPARSAVHIARRGEVHAPLHLCSARPRRPISAGRCREEQQTRWHYFPRMTGGKKPDKMIRGTKCCKGE